MGGSLGHDERQVSNALLVALFRYLERSGGRELVDEVVKATGTKKSVQELVRARWGGREELLALAEAAATRTGDPDIGRRAGEEMFRTNVDDPGTKAFFLSLGSPARAMEGVLEH